MPYKIIVADPSPSVQKAAQLVFAEPEFRVFAYEDGASLLESVASVGPDALIVSLTLPGRDGYDVARTLRSRKELATVPLVGLRGSFECIDSDRNAPSDYDEVLPKPFDSERLAGRRPRAHRPQDGAVVAARGAGLAGRAPRVRATGRRRPRP